MLTTFFVSYFSFLGEGTMGSQRGKESRSQVLVCFVSIFFFAMDIH